MSKRTWTDEELITAVKESKNKTEVLRKLGLSCHNSGNYQTVDRYIKKLNIDIKHFENGISHHEPVNTIPLDEILVKNSKCTNTVKLKGRLIKSGLLKDNCYACGISYWTNKKLNLHLDHIDGDHFNNEVSNLRLLCPNCHSLTSTYCRGQNKIKKINTCKDCGSLIQNKSIRCFTCSSKTRKGKFKIDWPNLENLNQMITDLGLSETGRRLGVSDNAVKKHIKTVAPSGIAPE